MDGNNEKVLSCLDDDRSSARQAAHQELLARWWYAVALAPFFIVLFVGLKFFAESTSRVFDVLVGASLTWAIGIAAYTFYLICFLECPRCGWRFGSGAYVALHPFLSAALPVCFIPTLLTWMAAIFPSGSVAD